VQRYRPRPKHRIIPFVMSDRYVCGVPQVGLYDNEEKADVPEGTARLTSHRLIFTYEIRSKVYISSAAPFQCKIVTMAC
jgi:hypothetical protein